MIDFTSLALGVAAVGVVYFTYLCVTKGVPAAWAWVKAKWTAGTTELAKIESEFSQQGGIVADLKNRVSAIEGHLGITAPPAPANPAPTPAPKS